VTLPGGVRVGHWTDRGGWTGCTVVLLPAGSVSACEVRGGGPGTRETDLLSPAAAVPGANAILLTGGSAHGLAAADGVARRLEQQGIGFQAPAGPVPLVAAAVVYDLGLGDPAARPRPEDAATACAAAAAGTVERGSVGAGTGCTVGKLLGADGWTKGGLGYAAAGVGDAWVAALAVVNAVGEVVGEDGRILAGAWDDAAGSYRSVSELVRGGLALRRPWREATTLVCVLTDGILTKTEAWLTARAASAGVARAVVPSATSADGDVAFCAATCAVAVDPLAVAVVAADVVAAAIRDAVRTATGAPGCPSAAERTAA
jgi:L-aminopeptidase/D-esterase-like protein